MGNNSSSGSNNFHPATTRRSLEQMYETGQALEQMYEFVINENNRIILEGPSVATILASESMPPIPVSSSVSQHIQNIYSQLIEQINEPTPAHVKTENINNYLPFLIRLEHQHAIETEPHEPIECVVEHETIQPGSYYYTCDQCYKSIISEHLKKWMLNNNSCPHCRYVFNGYPQMYRLKSYAPDLD